MSYDGIWRDMDIVSLTLAVLCCVIFTIDANYYAAAWSFIAALSLTRLAYMVKR